MFCPKCGKELQEYERSCPYCGAAAAHGRGNRHRIKPMELIAIAAGVLALIVACTVLVYQLAQRKKDAQMRTLPAGSRAAAAEAPAAPSRFRAPGALEWCGRQRSPFASCIA